MAKQDIIVINAQMRSADRPSLTKVCPCGSGKLYQKCCGVSGGHGLLTKINETFCLDSRNSCGQYIIVEEK